ncbi:MAG: ABC transporter substrate-binding protein [Chloroflexi bacterium]|nr:ABC transporter substrate-binding protein [Chloroflexota bacterium]
MWNYLPLAVSLAIVIGCSSGAEQTTPTTAAPAAGASPTVVAKATATPTQPPRTGRTGGKITVAQHWFSDSLDPGRVATTGHNVIGPMYDMFVRAGPDGVIDNKLGNLKSWTFSEDGKVMTWELKPGIYWHDGVEMTSADIQWTWERMGMGTGDQRATCLQCGVPRTNLDHIEIVDKYTAKIFMKNPDPSAIPAFSNMEGDMEIVAKHQFAKTAPARWQFEPLGSGPFKFVKFEPAQYIDFEANLKYWLPERVPSYDQLRIQLVPEPATRVALLETNAADLVSIVAGDAPGLKAKGYGLEGPTFGGWNAAWFLGDYLETNLGHNLLFRKAVVTGIDRETIVKKIYVPEVGVPMAGTTPFNPASMGYDPTLPIYPYDPEQAKKLLKESGYNGEKCVVAGAVAPTPLQPEQNEMSEAIAAYLQKMGINVEYQILDSATNTRKRGATWPYYLPENAGNCYFATIVGYNRNTMLGNIRVFMISVPAGGAIALYHDMPYIDKLYVELQRILDPGERERRFLELNRRLYNEYWSIPLVHRQLTFGVGPKVQRGSWGPTYGAYIDLAHETIRLK